MCNSFIVVKLNEQVYSVAYFGCEPRVEFTCIVKDSGLDGRKEVNYNGARGSNPYFSCETMSDRRLRGNQCWVQGAVMSETSQQNVQAKLQEKEAKCGGPGKVAHDVLFSTAGHTFFCFEPRIRRE